MRIRARVAKDLRRCVKCGCNQIDTAVSIKVGRDQATMHSGSCKRRPWIEAAIPGVVEPDDRSRACGIDFAGQRVTRGSDDVEPAIVIEVGECDSPAREGPRIARQSA